MVKEEIDQVLKVNNYKRIVLQFPDGLLDTFLYDINLFLEEKGKEVIIAGDPSYGACDLPTVQAEIMNADAIFHFGHSTFAFPPPKIGIAIHYFTVEADVQINWKKVLDELKKYQWKKIGLLTTIQHINVLNEIKKYTTKDSPEFLMHKEGQILGCNQNRATAIAKDVDAFLVLAGGDFHASPVVIATGKPTLRFDPFSQEFQLFDQNYRETYLKKRFAQITKAKDAKTWGILISLKSGQKPLDNGKRLVNLLKNAGKRAMLIPMFRVDPNHLMNFNKIDAWVINLCPRIATDDFVSFTKPILTARELLVALGLLDWNIFTNPIGEDQLLVLSN